MSMHSYAKESQSTAQVATQQAQPHVDHSVSAQNLQRKIATITESHAPVHRKVDPTTTVNGVAVNDDPGLEHEADVMGAQAASFTPASITSGEVAQQEKAPNNTGLPDNLKAGIENMSGMSMDAVKVHYNSEKPAQLNALAYAQGTDIHVGPGQEQHLPHEAWHVVQQGGGGDNADRPAQRSVGEDYQEAAEAFSIGAQEAARFEQSLDMKKVQNSPMMMNLNAAGMEVKERDAGVAYEPVHWQKENEGYISAGKRQGADLLWYNANGAELNEPPAEVKRVSARLLKEGTDFVEWKTTLIRQVRTAMDQTPGKGQIHIHLDNHLQGAVFDPEEIQWTNFPWHTAMFPRGKSPEEGRKQYHLLSFWWTGINANKHEIDYELASYLGHNDLRQPPLNLGYPKK